MCAHDSSHPIGPAFCDTDGYLIEVYHTPRQSPNTCVFVLSSARFFVLCLQLDEKVSHFGNMHAGR